MTWALIWVLKCPFVIQNYAQHSKKVVRLTLSRKEQNWLEQHFLLPYYIKYNSDILSLDVQGPCIICTHCTDMVKTMLKSFLSSYF